MPETKTAWGINIGCWALKAISLREAGENVEVLGFEVIPHDEVPGESPDDRRELFGRTLGRFLERRNLTGCHVVVSIGGASSCSRFVHLPPIDSEAIPDLVRYEAAQQVPFPLDEASWRWQTFRDLDDLDSPDVDVGIFAARRDDVGEMLRTFATAGVHVDTMQTTTLALYNFVRFNDQLAGDGATLLVDLGADDLDLVVADGRRIWTHTQPFGSRQFTRAIAEALGVDLPEAEAVQRDLANRDDDRLDATLEPLFAELARSVHRGLEDHATHHPGSTFTRWVPAGGGLRISGLGESLEKDLALPQRKIDPCERFVQAPGVDLAGADDCASLAAACGLALQGLGLTPIHANFLPSGIAHKRGGSASRPSGAFGRFLRSLVDDLRRGR